MTEQEKSFISELADQMIRSRVFTQQQKEGFTESAQAIEIPQVNGAVQSRGHGFTDITVRVFQVW